MKDSYSRNGKGAAAAASAVENSGFTGGRSGGAATAEEFDELVEADHVNRSS